MNPSEIISVLEERGAVLRGHFRLSSGRHSDVFVQKFRIFEHPKLTQRFGESIADMFAGSFDTVASPAVGRNRPGIRNRPGGGLSLGLCRTRRRRASSSVAGSLSGRTKRCW